MKCELKTDLHNWKTDYKISFALYFYLHTHLAMHGICLDIYSIQTTNLINELLHKICCLDLVKYAVLFIMIKGIFTQSENNILTKVLLIL